MCNDHYFCVTQSDVTGSTLLDWGLGNISLFFSLHSLNLLSSWKSCGWTAVVQVKVQAWVTWTFRALPDAVCSYLLAFWKVRIDPSLRITLDHDFIFSSSPTGPPDCSSCHHQAVEEWRWCWQVMSFKMNTIKVNLGFISPENLTVWDSTCVFTNYKRNFICLWLRKSLRLAILP